MSGAGRTGTCSSNWLDHLQPCILISHYSAVNVVQTCLSYKPVCQTSLEMSVPPENSVEPMADVIPAIESKAYAACGYA